MDPPICELCGEEEATLQLAEAAACDDCFAAEMTAKLLPVLGRKVCGQPVWYTQARLMNVCIEPYGTEHDHCSA